MKSKEKMKEMCCEMRPNAKCSGNNGCGNAIYGLGVIGALFYFLQGTTTFVAVITGIGKSFFWPAILMFKLLTFLQI
jgi:hypothetical protein